MAETNVKLMRELVDEALRQGSPVRLRDLAINGDDIVALGVKGPEVGRLLNQLKNLVVDTPELNNREQLLMILPSLMGNV